MSKKNDELNKAITQTQEDCLPLAGAIRRAKFQLKLGRDQLIAFCKAAPGKGWDLWHEYKLWYFKHPPGGNSFRHFVIEVLAGTSHPVVQK